MKNELVNLCTRAKRRYIFELGVSMIAYSFVLVISRWLLEGPARHAPLGWQLAIALTPMIPVIFVFMAIVRCVLGMDELMRRVQVNSLAVAGGATALLAVTYGLIEGGQLPRLSAWWTYGTFMMSWLVASVIVQRHYR